MSLKNITSPTSWFIFVWLLIPILLAPEAAQAKRRNRQKKRGPRPEYWCLKALRRAGVAYKRGPRLKNVRTPVTITRGRIGKLHFTNGSRTAIPRMDCRTALALLRTSRIFMANGGIKRLIVGKFYSYRYVKNRAVLSRHALGLALDIYGIKTADGKTYMVASSYERGLGEGKTCTGHAKSRGARLLRQLACDLDRSSYFRAILTPDSDRDHRDHFHLSVYRRGEKRYARSRTTLLESQNFAQRWVRKLPRKRYASKRRVRAIVRARYRANRRLIQRRRQQRRRKK